MGLNVLTGEEWKIIEIDYTRTDCFLTGLSTHKTVTSMTPSENRTSYSCN
jgi:hypothetical protein